MSVNKAVNRILAALVGMVLAVCFAALALTAAVWATVGSRSYAERTLRGQDYFSEVAAAQLERCAGYFTQAGIMQLMLPTIITPQAVEASMLYNLDAVYSGLSATLGLGEQFRTLQQELLAGFEADGIEITDELTLGLEAIIVECEESWLVATAVPGGSLLVGLVSSFAALRWWVLAVGGLVALWCVWLLWRLAGRGAFQLAGASLVGAGLALAVLAGLTLQSGAVAGLVPGFLLQATVVTAYLTDILRTVIVYGGVLCGAGALVWLAGLLAPKGQRAGRIRATRPAVRHDEL